MPKKRQSQFAKLPLRKVTDFHQINRERENFFETLLVVVFLALCLNYFTDILFAILNPVSSSDKLLHFSVSFAILLIVFFVIVKRTILKPIELRSTFYCGLLINPDSDSIHKPREANPLNVQSLLSSLKEQNSNLSFSDLDEVGEIVQYSILRWYSFTFSSSWLPTPKLISIGSAQTLGVEGVNIRRLIVPNDVVGAATNTVVSGNMFPGFEINLPPQTEIILNNERSELPHRIGKANYYEIVFSDRKVCTLRIKVFPTGYSILKGYEHLLPSDFDFPKNMNGWYFANHHISVEAVFPEPLFYRLGFRSSRPPLQYYYIWARKFLEGLETDFCYPLSFNDQNEDWSF